MDDTTAEAVLPKRERLGDSLDAPGSGEHQGHQARLRTRLRSFGTDLRDRNLPLEVANRTVLVGIGVIAGVLSAFVLKKARDRSREEQTFRARARKQARRFQDAFQR